MDILPRANMSPAAEKVRFTACQALTTGLPGAVALPTESSLRLGWEDVSLPLYPTPANAR